MEYTEQTEQEVREFLGGFGKDIGWDSETLDYCEDKTLVLFYDEFAAQLLLDLSRWCCEKNAPLTVEVIHGAKVAVRVGDDSFIGNNLEHAVWEAFVGLAAEVKS